MKLLWYGETPYIETGAGQVAKHLLPVLNVCFDKIDAVPINQWWIQEDKCPCLTIFECPKDDYFNTEQAKKHIANLDYDVLFLTADLNRLTVLKDEILLAKQARKPIVMYAAMDTHIYVKEFWEVLLLADIPIVFSNWCKRHALRILPQLEDTIQVVYHGTEPTVFYPLEREKRQEIRKNLFGIESDNTFLVLNVNRNQPRKDLARTLAAFHLFHKEYPDSLLYMHCKRQDVGGDLAVQAAFMGLQPFGNNPEVIFAPDSFHESSGVQRWELNYIYNAADVCISTSTGEGWGLSTTEAMSTGTPFIGPDNTVFPEILGKHEERGYLVESGGPNLWVMFYGLTDTPRELASVTDMFRQLARVYKFRETAREKADNARKWCLDHTWKHKQQQWSKLFEEAKTLCQSNT